MVARLKQENENSFRILQLLIPSEQPFQNLGRANIKNASSCKIPVFSNHILYFRGIFAFLRSFQSIFLSEHVRTRLNLEQLYSSDILRL